MYKCLNERSCRARTGGAARAVLTGVLAAALVASFARCASAQFYLQTNLVSDVPGFGLVTDTNLVGAWGVARSGTSPWWVNTTLSGLSLLFNGAGQPLPLVVAIPPTNPATATGIAFNGGTNFEVDPGKPARFIFATLNGVISGWYPGQPNSTLAVVKVNNLGMAGYTGLTLAQRNGADTLYAANFAQNRIDVFDGNFNPVVLSPGAFMLWGVPPSLAVFNVQAIDSSLYVTYAPTNVFGTSGGLGQGFVARFNVNGMPMGRLQHGFWMNAPWGVALAPGNFGIASHQLLVGMFGSGAIAVFDPLYGEFRGFLRNTDGLPIIISKGLWGIGFGNGASGGPTNALYYASDFQFNGGLHGKFGTLVPAPSQPFRFGFNY